jgi:hypothetical protein
MSPYSSLVRVQNQLNLEVVLEVRNLKVRNILTDISALRVC